MSPLEFFIAVHNSDANDSLAETQGKVDSFAGSVGELYEGPGREMKVRTEIRGMIKDIAMGESPMNALINAAERMSEAFRFAGPISAALAVGFALNVEMRAAAKSAGEFFDTFAKGSAVPIADASIDQLKELVKTMDEAEKKYGSRGFFEKLFYGGSETNAMSGAGGVNDIRNQALRQIDELRAAEINAKANALAKMTDQERAQAGEVAAVKAQYEEKIDDALKNNNSLTAVAYQNEMAQAIDAINAKYQKMDDERNKRQRDMIAELKHAQSDELTGEDKLADLQAQKAALQAKINSDAPGFLDPTGQRVQDEIALARLQKEINTEEASQKKAAAEAAAAAEKKALELRQKVAKDQFEALSKEDQVIALRAAQAVLEKNIAEAKKFGLTDDVLKFQGELARVQKELAAANAHQNPYAGINADTALRGAMASGSFTRVSNDAANRAEKQRDQTNDYLKAILGSFRGSNMSALDALFEN